MTPTTQIFSEERLPDTLRWQIISGMRAAWPDDYRHNRRLWISRPEFHPTYIVLMDGPFVLAHTVAIWKRLLHAKVTYMVYGLSMVFTYPDCRGQGYGRTIVGAGTAYIDQQPDADVAMLFCEPRLQAFYAQNDWCAMTGATTLITRSDGSVGTTGEVLLMRFCSEKGQHGRASFTQTPIQFGDTTW
jgi:GNAT superfamily N-acetyltransferase